MTASQKQNNDAAKRCETATDPGDADMNSIPSGAIAASNSQANDISPMATSKSYLGLAIAGTTMVGTLILTAPFVLQYIRSPLPYMATPKAKVQKALQFVAARKMSLRQQSSNATKTTTTSQQNRHHKHFFIDLGSGDGEAVYQALQQTEPFAYTKATGIELNSTLWALSQLPRNLLWGLDRRRRSSFVCRDMFTYDLRVPPEADTTVMIFGVKPLMQAISQKLARECQEGTHILAYRFPIPLTSSTGSSCSSGGGDGGGAGKDSTGSDSDSSRTETQDNSTQAPANDRDGRVGDDLLLAAQLVYDVEEMRVYECRKQPQARESAVGS